MRSEKPEKAWFPARSIEGGTNIDKSPKHFSPTSLRQSSADREATARYSSLYQETEMASYKRGEKDLRLGPVSANDVRTAAMKDSITLPGARKPAPEKLRVVFRTARCSRI